MYDCVIKKNSLTSIEMPTYESVVVKVVSNVYQNQLNPTAYCKRQIGNFVQNMVEKCKIWFEHIPILIIIPLVFYHGLRSVDHCLFAVKND